VQGLFNLTHPDCASTTPVGCPALASLTNGMVVNGLPAAGVFYNDQLVSSTFSPGGANPLVASEVGTWQFADSNEVIALDIAYATYATNQQYYKEAFTAGIAAALGVQQDAVYGMLLSRACLTGSLRTPSLARNSQRLPGECGGHYLDLLRRGAACPLLLCHTRHVLPGGSALPVLQRGGRFSRRLLRPAHACFVPAELRPAHHHGLLQPTESINQGENGGLNNYHTIHLLFNQRNYLRLMS